MVASIALGSLIGETIDLDGKLKLLGDAVERKLGDCGSGFSKGFVSTTLIFCTGSMAVMGGLEEGFGHFPTTLLTKGMIDGITNIAFSATLGFGVIFSSIPVFLYQGMFTIAAKWLAPLMTETAITEMTAVGGIMLMAVGINMMELKKTPSHEYAARLCSSCNTYQAMRTFLTPHYQKYFKITAVFAILFLFHKVKTVF